MSRTFAVAAFAATAVLIGVTAGMAHAARAKTHPHAPVAAKTDSAAAAKPPTSAAPHRPAADLSAGPFGGLLGLDEAGARARLGAPDIARAEGAGALWTYRLTDCALFVFFKKAEGQPMKVSGAASGPRERGRAPLPVEACIAQAKASVTGAPPARPGPI